MTDAASIQSRAVPPPPALAPYISAFLLTRIQAEAGPQTVDIFPVGHAVMSFALDDHPVLLDGRYPARSKWNLTGQLLQPHHIAVGGAYSYVYVLFKPAGAYRLLSGDQRRIEDHFTAVEAWLPDERTVGSLHAMKEAGMDGDAVLSILLEWFLARLLAVAEDSAYRLGAGASARIAESGGAVSIGELCAEFYVSETKLERLFRRVVGTSPKRFCRIVRFNNAYAVIQSGIYSDWAEVVHKHAYFDQAHFIREFKGFCGYTPAALHKSVMSMAGHVVDKRR